MTTKQIKARLQYLRKEIEAQRISQSEIAELQALAQHIDRGDVLLLEWAGLPEAEDITNAPLTLATDCNTIGNNTGAQIDTLAKATPHAWTRNECYENNFYYLQEVANSAIEQYPHFERDYIDTLTATQRKYYTKNLDEFRAHVQGYAITTKNNYEQGDGSPLDAYVSEWVADAEEQMYKEWLYGDRSNRGLLQMASNFYGVEFEYDQKNDVITYSMRAGTIEDLKESGELDAYDVTTVTLYLQATIENNAHINYARQTYERRKRAQEYIERKKYQAERAKREQAELDAKTLKALKV